MHSNSELSVKLTLVDQVAYKRDVVIFNAVFLTIRTSGFPLTHRLAGHIEILCLLLLDTLLVANGIV